MAGRRYLLKASKRDERAELSIGSRRRIENTDQDDGQLALGRKGDVSGDGRVAVSSQGEAACACRNRPTRSPTNQTCRNFCHRSNRSDEICRDTRRRGNEKAYEFH